MGRNIVFCIFFFVCAFPLTVFAQEEQPDSKSLVLQEMSWVDVQEYLVSNDMVIIPVGSTEQHGPHLPLGTDYFSALEMSKQISEQTGVITAPILLVGYSEYHSGFPGTLNVTPETMERVLFESVEMLIKYGFHRFMIFNGHGGNNIVQDNLIHRINHSTEASAIAIGYGSSLQRVPGRDPFDAHAGKRETSNMLYLMPQYVRMDKAVRPEIHLTPEMQSLLKLSETNPELLPVLFNMFGIPAETNKGGASHELSDTGVGFFTDPGEATAEMGHENVSEIVNKAVRFIEAWKEVER